MKLKSTSDGLKAVKVNPYSCKYKEALSSPYNDFEASNPELPLTMPMPGNTVFEGEEVWMEHSEVDADDIWRPCQIIGNGYVCMTGFIQKKFYQPEEPIPDTADIVRKTLEYVSANIYSGADLNSPDKAILQMEGEILKINQLISPA